MGKTVFALFTHPDDESFGPSGTIAFLAKTNDVYLICATKGEAVRIIQKQSNFS